MVKEGIKAPDFKLKDAEGKEHSLSDYKGKNVIVYFYPRDDTPGCTIEACNFRDDFSKYKQKGAVILGISPDDSESHQKFTDKFKLPFTLLSDPDRKVIKEYGAWGDKVSFGQKKMGLIRSTVLIDKAGKIKKRFGKVNVKDHSQEILELL